MKFVSRTGGVYELLRASIDITEVLGTEVGEKVDCVFHDEDDIPDLHVYEDHAHCFACGGHGDVTKVWKAKHGFSSMWEAAQDLASKFDVELPQVNPEARARYEERRRKEDEHARVAAERHAALKDPHNRTGAKVQQYLRDRGITDEIRDRFMLGATEIGDLNIPFWVGTQVHGQVVRRLEGRTPKYVAPKAEDFPLGRRPILMVGSPKPQSYLLVEGYLDQPAAEVLGIPAIGTGAARLSKEQVADLRELGEKGATFYVLPDGDEAGSEAARTNTAKLYPYAYMTPPIPIEGVKDVSDLHRHDEENAAAILEELMAEGRDAVEIALSELPKRPTDKVRHLKREIVPLVIQLEHRSEREAVIKEIAKADGLNTKIVSDAVTEQEVRAVVFHATDEAEEGLPESEWAPLLEPGVLDRYVSDAFKIKSVVGEGDRNVVKFIVCDALEAQLEPLPTGKPIGGAIMLTGDSGRGKNYLADAAVCGLPESWYLSFEAASATAFYYAAEVDPAFLKHKFIYPNEAEAVDTVVEFLRPMLSQAKAKKYVTNKNSDGSHVFQEIQVEGPITGVVPTTRNTLNRELQTRMLVCELPNYENRIKEHTAALSRQFSPDFVADPHGHIVPKWRAAFSSLTGVRRVVIPFGTQEEFRLDNEDIGHGARLWGNLLGLMCAHAWLEQRNREVREVRDGTKAVVATAEDYKAAYELLKSVGSRSVVNLGDTHRKIVQAVYDLTHDDNGPPASDGFGVRAIAEKAGVSPGTVTKNRAFLTKSAGLLYEIEGTSKLSIVDDADPSWWDGSDVMSGFPRPDEVAGWDTPPPEPRSSGNKETLDQKPLTYAAEGVSWAGNGVETVSTGVSTNGSDPLAGDYRKAEAPTREARESSEGALAYDPDEPANFWDLSGDERERVLAWIRSRFTPHPWLRLKVGYLRDSYNFKALFERCRGGFYIDNGTFKGAMLEAGFTPVSPDDGWAWSLEDMAFDQNWSFRGKQKYDPDPPCKVEQMEWALDAIRGWPRPVGVGVAAKERRIPRAKVGKLTETLLFLEKERYARFTDGGWEPTWRVPQPPRHPARLSGGK